MNNKLDQLARLLILDGAFGTHFSKLPLRRGLRAARQEIGDQVHPGWTDPGDSGIYSSLLHKVARALPKNSLVTPEDVLQNSLAGISQEGEPCQNPFMEAGKRFPHQITTLSTPCAFSQQQLSYWIWRKAQNEHKGSRKIKDWSKETDPVLTNPERNDSFRALLQAFRDDKSALGQHLREGFRSIYPTGTRRRLYLDFMMDTLEETGQLPGPTEIGTKFGIRPQSLGRMNRQIFNGSEGMAIDRDALENFREIYPLTE